MMARESTRARERAYFEQFRQHFDLPAGEVEYGDAPDVIVRGDRTVGIELANLYLVDGGDPTSLQQQRRFRERVIAVAQAHYEAAGGARFEFTIGFDPRTPVTHVDRVGTALAEIALQAQVGDGGELLRSCHARTPEIHSINRTRSTYSDARWRGVQGFMVPLIDPKRVQDAVDAKLQKLPAYRRCDSHWLLLVVDFMDSAQDVELQWRADAELRRGGFDRVLIYKPQFAEWFEPASAP